MSESSAGGLTGESRANDLSRGNRKLLRTRTEYGRESIVDSETLSIKHFLHRLEGIFGGNLKAATGSYRVRSLAEVGRAEPTHGHSKVCAVDEVKNIGP